MSYFGSSLAPPSSGLTASGVNSLIQQMMVNQRKPIYTLTSKKDTLNIEKAIYSDIKTKLSTLESIVGDLTNGAETIFLDMSTTVADSKVVTATAASSAVSGTYTVDVTVLAEAHRVFSDTGADSTDTALGLTAGTFTLNGADISVLATDSLEDIVASINAAEYGESLGFTGPNEIDIAHITELDEGTLSADMIAHFALEGITLSEDATVSVDTTGERWIITDRENSYSIRDEGTNLGVYKGGREVTATIVDDRLVLEADSTGVDYALDFTGSADIGLLKGTLGGATPTGLGILDAGGLFIPAQERVAVDSAFTVNGVPITRSSNTGLDDVIDGVTLNLLSVDETEITIASHKSNITGKVTAMVNSINDIASYLKQKATTTADEEKKTYTRGALAGKSLFSILRMDLIGTMNMEVDAGPLKRMSDIGITIGNGLEISLDATKLGAALDANFEDVVQLFDTIMQRYTAILDPFTATSASTTTSTLDLYTSAIQTKMDNIDTRVERMEKMLLIKEELLITQYSGLYMRSMQLQNDQQNLLSIYSSLSMYG